MILQLLQERNRSSPPSDLTLALMDLAWPRALDLVNSPQGPRLCSRWALLQGFFDGTKDASVLPLHQACAVAQVPVDLISALLRAYPKAVTERESSYQRLPLHCACRTAADPAIVRALLQVEAEVVSREKGDDYIMACLVPDVLGRLPLHYALSNGANPETISMLLQTAPRAAEGVDSRGWMPLHVACSVGCSLEVLQQVYAAYPHAIVVHTSQGSSPAKCLHKTVSHRWQLKDFLKKAKEEYCMKQPASQPFQQQSPKRQHDFSREPISRATSSPHVLHVAPSGGILEDRDRRNGLTRSMSDDGASSRPRRAGRRAKKSLPIENCVFV